MPHNRNILVLWWLEDVLIYCVCTLGLHSIWQIDCYCKINKTAYIGIIWSLISKRFMLPQCQSNCLISALNPNYVLTSYRTWKSPSVDRSGVVLFQPQFWPVEVSPKSWAVSKYLQLLRKCSDSLPLTWKNFTVAMIRAVQILPLVR